MSSWIQVPIISSSTHPNDDGNGDIALHSDEVLPPLDDNFERPLFDSDEDGSDDDYIYFNQRIGQHDPDYLPNAYP